LSTQTGLDALTQDVPPLDTFSCWLECQSLGQCQSIVALSSTEVEYIAIAKGAQQAMWLTEFLNEEFLSQPTPFTLLGDNLGSIALTKTTKGHNLSKNIDINYHFICDLVEAH
jgi:hypothetical protein